ncbi:phosphatase PAP2 family protein [Oceanicoccus sagamiensis]|uniref:undecaprenyl-diphosphate phosphatase n=1 Tax=Oceanicoccus sagamiensis TaxID=716816 RepID=A0A1X9N9E8_9GAMM|nr:phosphatase PAP2 family protein [Oceanicoccus sagamiensis]ARN74708.1 hypothetical protein BST96_11595 [Oceanicoccus sagamiensis]
MLAIQQWGIDFILMLQSYQSPFLDSFFYLITQLGGMAYLAVVPLVIWCINPRLGIRALLAMLVAQYLVMLIKDIVQEPRPYLADDRIISSGERGYSFPSGHAMGSMVFYGLLLLCTDKKWLRIALVGLIILIGLSRNYLGVHYPHDVVIGWVLGIIYLYSWFKWQPLVSKAFYQQTLSKQLLLLFAVPALIASLHYFWLDTFRALAVAGAVSACVLSLMADSSRTLLHVKGHIIQLAGRYIIGMVLLLATLTACDAIVPADGHLFYNVVVWVNGFTMSLMTCYFAPRLFGKIKLAQ